MDPMVDSSHSRNTSNNLRKMAHGLERLERLISGSKRREREKLKAAQQQLNDLAAKSRQPSGPIFPSPSYLRPTSMQMIARDPKIEGRDGDKGRSHSVPSMQQANSRRSSGASSITVVADRPGRSDNSTSPLRHEDRGSQPASRLARFRFPEDSIFRNDQLGRERTKEPPTRDISPRALEPRRPSEKKLMDWNPELFDPLEFKTSFNDRLWGPTSETTESTLLPSPDFVQPTPISDSCRRVSDASTLISRPPRISQCDAVQKLTLNLRQKSIAPYSKPLILSPSVSDKRQNAPRHVVRRSISLNVLSPRPDTPLIPIGKAKRGGSVRGTRCKDLEDLGLNQPVDGEDETGWPLKSLRKSASTSTLSLLELQLTSDDVLLEPTFDDFYGLSDDDIAESPPPTPAYVFQAPPTPPRKDTPRLGGLSHTPRSSGSQDMGYKHRNEEITPPRTPTNSHTITPASSPISPRDTTGALMAAELAKKYGFAVLYVLSLWPLSEISNSSTLGSTQQMNSQSPNTTRPTRHEASSKKSKMTGRVLAAYGLQEVPSPFEIVTETHLAALDCEEWNEYRNTNAGVGNISRGWIRGFHSNYQVSGTEATTTAGSSLDDCSQEGGIVFGAYTKRGADHIIPPSGSTERDLLLNQISSDAISLVEALAKHPSNQVKTWSPARTLQKGIIESQSHMLCS
ncbi:hypothetical protein GGS20DRAFT_339352 [Poronia punctata]|nr:hypothetical protein GGS20DRAFT_339352 [Poronia punctata]